MATNYGVISKQDWDEFLSKTISNRNYSVNYDGYIETLDKLYKHRILHGDLTLQTTKNEVTKAIHKDLFDVLIRCFFNSGRATRKQNNTELASVVSLYTKYINKTFE